MALGMAEQIEEMERAHGLACGDSESLEVTLDSVDENLDGCNAECTMGSNCTFRTIQGEPFDGLKYIEHHYAKRQLGFKIQQYLNPGINLEVIWKESEGRGRGLVDYKIPEYFDSFTSVDGSADVLVRKPCGSYPHGTIGDKVPVTTTTSEQTIPLVVPKRKTAPPKNRRVKNMALVTNGSPTPRKTQLNSFVTDANDDEWQMTMGVKRTNSTARKDTPPAVRQASFKQKQKFVSDSGVQQSSTKHVTDPLLVLLNQHNPASSSSGTATASPDSNQASSPSFCLSPDNDDGSANASESAEQRHLRRELEIAVQTIRQKEHALARKDEELSQYRITSLTLNHLIPDGPSPIKMEGASNTYDIGPNAYPMRAHAQNHPSSTRQHTAANNLWASHDGTRSPISGIPSAFAKNQTIWNSVSSVAYPSMNITAMNTIMPTNNDWNLSAMAPSGQNTPAPSSGSSSFYDPRSTQGSYAQAYGGQHTNATDDARISPRNESQPAPLPVSTSFPGPNQNNQYGPIGSRMSPFVPTVPMGQRGSPTNLPGSRLSPTATEFSFETSSSGPWDALVQQIYVPPTEPINYRKLLERNMNSDWSYIVDKIIYNNDQQASIFLQQKLKLCTPEQKDDIIVAITKQGLGLMMNRFGNFLIQRCFEHGSEDQVIALAETMDTNIVQLSMDAFGCHVVQKAFDCVPEDFKIDMVHELLQRIQDTVIHRYACHVWQKLFELRWNGPPPMIMDSVNRALQGRWHEVALGETGSLVVQNIFENCTELDKRPCVDEVLARIDEIAKGQFGNWCVQHICEHGNPYDSRAAINAVLTRAPEYSMDQYASKVVEKLLKIGGDDFLEKWLKVVTKRIVSDNPRTHLIDISSDQFGNYLVQWILVNASPHLREIVASEIRRHMVSLRGSKFGSRVAMLCCNPAFTIRPGAPAMPQMHSQYGSPRWNQYQPYGAGNYSTHNSAYNLNYNNAYSNNNNGSTGYHQAPPAGPSSNRYNSNHGGAFR